MPGGTQEMMPFLRETHRVGIPGVDNLHQRNAVQLAAGVAQHQRAAAALLQQRRAPLRLLSKLPQQFRAVRLQHRTRLFILLAAGPALLRFRLQRFQLRRDARHFVAPYLLGQRQLLMGLLKALLQCALHILRRQRLLIFIQAGEPAERYAADAAL